MVSGDLPSYAEIFGKIDKMMIYLRWKYKAGPPLCQWNNGVEIRLRNAG
jgi:hypothetical protein